MKHLRWVRASALLTVLLVLLAGSALAASSGVLRYGDTGAEVRQLQQALSTLGYKNVTVDGTFGAFTENAVRSFQRDNGLKVDGLAGNATQTLLYKKISSGETALPTATPAPQTTAVPSGGSLFGGNYATIKHGMTGDRVRLLQTALNSAGYGSLKVDGKFGTGTLTAVMVFQRAQGLTVDGAAGKLTLTRLESVLSGGNAPIVTAAPVVTDAPTMPPVSPTTAPGTAWVKPARKLYSGATGEDVKSLQGRLKELGYYTGAIDGKFGTGTLTAVMAFQRDNKLTADGVAGTQTYAKLFPDSAAPTIQPTATPVPTPKPGDTTVTLKKNATGLNVLRMQGALALLDYSPNVYGTYDNTTVAAVKEFQTRNGLTADGIAGPNTLAKLYSGTAVRGTATGGSAVGVGTMAEPPVSQLRLLHWFNEIKPNLKSGASFLVYDPATGLCWKLHLMSAGRHADVEPLTAQDTAIQYRAFGNRNEWGPKPVYVLLPDGRWTVGGLSNVPHGSQTIKGNDFNGQNCLHFLRDMDEAEKNDPKTGVNNQKTIRTFWQWLTGNVVN